MLRLFPVLALRLGQHPLTRHSGYDRLSCIWRFTYGMFWKTSKGNTDHGPTGTLHGGVGHAKRKKC